MCSPLALYPSGRQQARRMAPPASNQKRFGRPNDLHRRNTMYNNTRQYQSHGQPNSRGGFAPSSHSRHFFKRSNPNWKRKKSNNMRAGQNVYREDRSNYQNHPPAPHNTSSFLRRAWNSGGIAFDSPRDYTPRPDYINPNPSRHYSPRPDYINPNPSAHSSPRPDYQADDIPTSPAINPNPSPHHTPGSDYGCTTPIIYHTLSPPIDYNDNSAASVRRRLERENTTMKFRLECLEAQVKAADRRLDQLELIHNDKVSTNNNKAVKASCSENSIGN